MVECEAGELVCIGLHGVQHDWVGGADMHLVIERTVVLVREGCHVSNHSKVMEWQGPVRLQLRESNSTSFYAVQNARTNIHRVWRTNLQIGVLVRKPQKSSLLARSYNLPGACHCFLGKRNLLGQADRARVCPDGDALK